MGIIITETAQKEIKRVFSDQELEDTTILRVAVEGGGCSGFMYSLKFEDTTELPLEENMDHVTAIDGGIRVAVDKKSLLFLDGTTLDFKEDINQRGFVFDNPQAVKTCGCNKSFSTG